MHTLTQLLEYQYLCYWETLHYSLLTDIKWLGSIRSARKVNSESWTCSPTLQIIQSINLDKYTREGDGERGREGERERGRVREGGREKRHVNSPKDISPRCLGWVLVAPIAWIVPVEALVHIHWDLADLVGDAFQSLWWAIKHNLNSLHQS